MLVPVLLVMLAPGEAGEAACSAQQMQGAWLASLSTSCRPRPTLLSLGDLVTPAPGHTLAHPTHIEVDRCAGSCSQGTYINDLTLNKLLTIKTMAPMSINVNIFLTSNISTIKVKVL